MRGLKTMDLFSAVRIIESMDIKPVLSDLVKESGNKSNTELGLEMMYEILCRSSNKKTEQQIYEFIGNLIEIPAKQVGEMDPTEMLNKLLDVADIEAWISFFERCKTVILRK